MKGNSDRDVGVRQIIIIFFLKRLGTTALEVVFLSLPHDPWKMGVLPYQDSTRQPAGLK